MNLLAINVTSAITSQPITIEERALIKSLAIEGAISNSELSVTERFKSKYRRFKRRMHRVKEELESKVEEYGAEFSSSSSDEEDHCEQVDRSDIASLISLEMARPDVSNEAYYWEGKDYSNCYKEDFKDLHEYAKDQFDRTSVQRMPWRDEAMCVFGESGRDIARHFIQRWNHCKYEMEPQNPQYPFLIPKSPSFELSKDYQKWFQHDLFKCSTQVIKLYFTMGPIKN